MIPLAERLAEHRRLAILRCLADQPAEERERLLVLALLVLLPQGAGNVSLLRDLTLDAGAPILRDKILAHGAWLADHGLVVAGRDQSGVDTLAVTERGAEIAEGRRAWPGVAPVANLDWLCSRLASLAVAANRAEVEADIAFLAAAGLVDAGAAGPMLVLTGRGGDVAAGREVVTGVRKPSFGAVMRAGAAAAKSILER
ncbi:hypothetical protein KXS07_23780 [Inquilinus limosus]|uniref:hypothetical protein n=1 Tax=Inquilinus limosus TaxID=171674 RepID=UPI003F136499